MALSKKKTYQLPSSGASQSGGLWNKTAQLWNFIFYQTRLSRSLLWLWMKLARYAVSHVRAEIPASFPARFSITECAGDGPVPFEARKYTISACATSYWVVQQSVSSADYLSDKHMLVHSDFLALNAGGLIYSVSVCVWLFLLKRSLYFLLSNL